MNQGLVSVVIPVYNMEVHLDKCVNSVVNQSYKELEIILIDDGSSDSSPQKCDCWATSDERIRVIHKPNAGLGMARNTGIEEAHGQFIFFIDSDDYIELDTIEECIAIAKSEDADLVCFGNDIVTLDGKVVNRRIPSPPQKLYCGKEILEKLAPMAVSYDAETGESWELSLSACFSMFSMKTVRDSGWRFVSEREIISEDYYSVLQFYQHANRIAIIDKALYHYTINENSLTRTYRVDRYDQVVHFSKEFNRLIDEIGGSAVIKKQSTTLFLDFTISAMKQIVLSKAPTKKRFDAIKHIVTDAYCQQQLQSAIISGDNWRKKLLYLTMRNKAIAVCYFLVLMKAQ